MNKNIIFKPATPEDGSEEYTYTVPVQSNCPCCHNGANPIILDGFYHTTSPYCMFDYPARAYAFCLCTSCEKLFVMPYGGNSLKHLTPLSPFPQYAAQPEFNKEVQELSPAFCKIFSQAAEAEAQGLSDICGLGYRKALEFLVKDYVKHLHQEDADPIESESLGATIKRINNDRIQTLAQRAAWLGNDETHYVRRHLDRDVSDMKTFINAMLNFIVSELSFEDALSISPK